ncbi:hypothetical protein ACWCQN_16130 [Streptomyces sp. NPDC001984]
MAEGEQHRRLAPAQYDTASKTALPGHLAQEAAEAVNRPWH